MEETRNIKQVMAISSVAKLDPSDLIGQPQCLYFSEDLNRSDMKLVEVDSSVMAYVEEGKDLVIRGDKTESAVMCLEDMTFDLKEAETSNTLLLLDKCLGVEDFEGDGPDLHHFEIQGVAHKYLELRPMRPKLQKLRLLLNQNPYAGDIYEDTPEHSGQKFTMEDLLEKVQASKKEIIEELKQIRACCIKGALLERCINSFKSLLGNLAHAKSFLKLRDFCAMYHKYPSQVFLLNGKMSHTTMDRKTLLSNFPVI